MRFRLATTGASGGGADPTGGIGNAFRTMAMMPLYAQQAAQEGQEAQARLGLLGAQQRQAEAAAAASAFKLQEEQRAAQEHSQRTGPGALLVNAALMHGVSPAEAPDFAQFAQTGQLPSRYAAPADGVGPVMPTPAAYNGDTASRIFQTLGLSQHALAAGDKNVANLAKAQEGYRSMGLGDDILAGRRTAADVGRSQAAIEGKDLVSAIGNTGMGFDRFSGAGQQIDPGLRAIFGDQAVAGIAADRARAEASRASAASSYASAAKTRQEIQDGAGRGKAPTGYRFKADGSLEAIPGGPADIKAGELGAKADQRREAAATAAASVRQAVNDARGLIGYGTSGVGSLTAAIPGTPARNLQAKLDTIKANLGFDRLQQMREMSPTGGALGAVAVQELIALQSTVSSLDQAQSPAELRASLDKIDRHYKRWEDAVNGVAPARTLQRTGAPAAPAPQTGGASGGWGDPALAAGGGWSIQRVE